MGDVPSILGLLASSGMMDKDILSVINPAAANRDRHPAPANMPPQEAWRNDWTLGKVLNPATQVVRANHFKVDCSALNTVYQYVVHLYRLDKAGQPAATDCAGDEDSRISYGILAQLRDAHPEWGVGTGVGLTYNGRSVIFTTALLPFTLQDDHGQPMMSEIVRLKGLGGKEGGMGFRVALTLVSAITMPAPNAAAWGQLADERVLLSLDSTLLAFARWGARDDSPEWFVVGSKVSCTSATSRCVLTSPNPDLLTPTSCLPPSPSFQAFRADSREVPLSSVHTAKRGYYAGLKTCLAGLVLVCDMSVSCFLSGGPMVNVLWHAGEYRSFDEMASEARSPKGIAKWRLDKMTEAIKNAKITVIHLGTSRLPALLQPFASPHFTSFHLTSHFPLFAIPSFPRSPQEGQELGPSREQPRLHLRLQREEEHCRRLLRQDLPQAQAQVRLPALHQHGLQFQARVDPLRARSGLRRAEPRPRRDRGHDCGNGEGGCRAP